MEDDNREIIQARTRRIVMGLMFVAAGLLLTIEGRSIFQIGSLWPLLFIVPGLGRIIGACCPGHRRGGYWLLGLGLWFALNEYTALGYHHTWPLLLVFVGGMVAWEAVAPAGPCPARSEGHHAG